MSKIIHSEIQKDGFQVIKSAVDKSLIDNFNKKYEHIYDNVNSVWLSYLPSRTEYMNDANIVKLMCSESLDDYAESIGVRFSFHMVEARIGSSNIQWHRDFNEGLDLGDDSYDGRVIAGDHYYGAIIALDDFGDNCGPFEIVPGSHTWKIDKSIINYKNMMENPGLCYGYYQKIIDEKRHAENISTYEFKGKKGDFIIWHGSSIHRGKQSELPQEMWETDSTSFRNTFFFHFSILKDDELNKEFQTTYVKVDGRKNLYLTRPS